MSPDQCVHLFRELLTQAALLSAPLLLAAALVSLAVSLLQTLTGIQEQTLTAVPRLSVVFLVTMIALPWMIHRLVNYTLQLFSDLHRYLG